MNGFLYSLAEMKYMMYHELYQFRQSAYTEEECFRRIKYQSKYRQLLDIIDMLPNKESLELKEIERSYFPKAPYVIK